MSTSVFVDYAAIDPQPWRNGRGVTRNLFDDADAAGHWTWRISIAEITGTQPYSAYPGVRREQVALGPGDVALTIDGREELLHPEGIVVFDGEAEVVATPSEEGFLDLNVMTRRDAWTSEVRIVTAAAGAEASVLDAGDADVVVLVALADGCSVDGRTRDRLDATMLASGGPSTVAGRFVVARLHRV